MTFFFLKILTTFFVLGVVAGEAALPSTVFRNAKMRTTFHLLRGTSDEVDPSLNHCRRLKVNNSLIYDNNKSAPHGGGLSCQQKISKILKDDNSN